MADTQIVTKKFVKVGNSKALIFDKATLDEYFDGGSLPVQLHFDDQKKEIRLVGNNKAKVGKDTKKKILASKVTPEFQAWVEKSLSEDAESLRELANL